MDLHTILDVVKAILPTGLGGVVGGIAGWFAGLRAERKVYQAHLYALNAEVTWNRALLHTYLMDIRARFYHLTETARFDPNYYRYLLRSIREVIPDSQEQAVADYMARSNQQWSYRRGAPPWPPLTHMEELARRQTAVRALSDTTLLDRWDQAVEQLERNRDRLVEEWASIESQPEPNQPHVAPEDDPEPWALYQMAVDRREERVAREVTPVARGLLVGADEAEQLGAELAAALTTALRKATQRRALLPVRRGGEAAGVAEEHDTSPAVQADAQ